MPDRSIGIIGRVEETGGAAEADSRGVDAQALHPHVRRQKSLDRLCSADHCTEAAVVPTGTRLGNTATHVVHSVKLGEAERAPLIARAIDCSLRGGTGGGAGLEMLRVKK